MAETYFGLDLSFLSGTHDAVAIIFRVLPDPDFYLLGLDGSSVI